MVANENTMKKCRLKLVCRREERNLTRARKQDPIKKWNRKQCAERREMRETRKRRTHIMIGQIQMITHPVLAVANVSTLHRMTN